MVSTDYSTGIRHPQLTGSKLFSPTKTSRFPHTLGVHDPTRNATSHFVTRAEETALNMSYNAQSEAPDIPGFSIRTAIAQYTTSLQTQEKAPDISSRSLRVSKHELSVSLFVLLPLKNQCGPI